MQRTTACNGVGGRADLEINIARADPLMRSVTNLPTAHVPRTCHTPSHPVASSHNRISRFLNSSASATYSDTSCDSCSNEAHSPRFLAKNREQMGESRKQRLWRLTGPSATARPQPSPSLPSARSALLFLSTRAPLRCVTRGVESQKQGLRWRNGTNPAQSRVSPRRNGHPAVSPPQITSHDVRLKLANLATAY
jgi:hypothetical protein